MKKLTQASSKKIGVPKTAVEAYEYLKKKNKNLDILKKHFDLYLEL